MKTDEEDLLEQISKLESANLNLKSEIAFLNGKIEVYEQFLKRQGFIKDDEDTNVPNIVNVPFVNRRTNPIDGSWVCPYCGKKVYSMEVHKCNQPYC